MSRDRVVLVTRNQHKLRELEPLFREYGVPFDTTDHEKWEIRSDDVVEIARVAAERAFEVLRRPLVVDDTAFYIDALNGFPRTYPAFVLQTIGRRGILKLMEDVADRRARFITAVAYQDDELSATFKGTMEGHIATDERGMGGFGYDPIFIPEGHHVTYAQLSLEQKVAISHRSRAFRAFLDWYVSL